jgi:hypothetical protein
MKPWCSAELVAELLGFDLIGDPRLTGAVRSWAARFRGDGMVVRQATSGLEVHRHALEAFLLQNGLISWKWAAIYYGLQTQVLKDVVDRLEGNGDLVQVRSGVSDQLVCQREAAALFRAFPLLRNKVFASRSGMCITLYAAIKSDLDIDVTPLPCVTSAILEPTDPDIAVTFDAITMDPVGLRYQVWLETNKPVNLAADVCSLKFYAQNEAALREHVMKGGEPETIDNRLRAA